MELNKEYKRISASACKDNADALNGKIVDKVIFKNNGNADENIFIIMFTDKTYIAIGTHYRDIDKGDEEPQLKDFYVIDPSLYSSLESFTYLDKDGSLHFYGIAKILKELGIWKISEEEVAKQIQISKDKEEAREYAKYLELKKKFENI